MNWQSANHEREAERNRQLFLAVMAGIKEYYYPWNQTFGRNDIMTRIFEAAGISMSEIADSQVDSYAFSRWQEDGRPLIELHPNIKMTPPDIFNKTVFHELFHLISPIGMHLQSSFALSEVLANLFAREMSHPMPIVTHIGQRTLEIPAGSAPPYYPVNELLRATNRQAFAISHSYQTGESLDYRRVVLFQLESFSKIRAGTEELWDAFLAHAWAAPNAVLRPMTDCYELAVDIPGSLNCISQHGVVHYMGPDNVVWDRLNGIESLISELQPSIEKPRPFALVEIPAVCESGVNIRGGHHFVVCSNYIRQNDFRRMSDGLIVHSLLFIEDERDGSSLAWAWYEAGLNNRSGPFLLAGDAQPNTHPKTFEDWVMSVEKKFLSRPSQSDLDAVKFRLNT